MYIGKNIMDTFLDVQALVDERRKHENGKLNIFKKVLQQCYAQIKRYNKDKIYEMDFKIPVKNLQKGTRASDTEIIH